MENQNVDLEKPKFWLLTKILIILKSKNWKTWSSKTKNKNSDLKKPKKKWQILTFNQNFDHFGV